MDSQHQPFPLLMKKQLDILFIGINPSTTMSSPGHYFGGDHNMFWKCFNHSCIIQDRTFTAEDDVSLFQENNIGFVNVVERPTESCKDLLRSEMSTATRLLLDHMPKIRPATACFVGRAHYDLIYHSSSYQRWGAVNFEVLQNPKKEV
ncbi:uracil-DNA glycosylase-like protein [Chlamydoabsidia padenii]|nr:uracil-DNA glycosylase-like protein [Chlamydoabsidia padenii]